MLTTEWYRSNQCLAFPSVYTMLTSANRVMGDKLHNIIFEVEWKLSGFQTGKEQYPSLFFKFFFAQTVNIQIKSVYINFQSGNDPETCITYLVTG